LPVVRVVGQHMLVVVVRGDSALELAYQLRLALNIRLLLVVVVLVAPPLQIPVAEVTVAIQYLSL
jgi:hypothetical protein